MDAIIQELRVKAGARQAYEAVATSAGIKGWWAKNSDIGQSVGDKVELRFTRPEMSAVMDFEVSALEPDRRVEWTCTENTNPIWPGSKLQWLFEPAEQGSKVVFSHSGFSAAGPPYDRTVEGWKFFVESLQRYLNGEPAMPSD